MADTKRYDQLKAGDVLAGGAKVLQAGPMGPAQPDTYSRKNPMVEVEYEDANGLRHTVRGAPDAVAQMEAKR
jgi:hypothetical protein